MPRASNEGRAQELVPALTLPVPHASQQVCMHPSRPCCSLAGFALPVPHAAQQQLQGSCSIPAQWLPQPAQGLRGCGDQMNIQDLKRLLLLLEITQPLI